MALLNGRPADPEALRVLALTNYGHFTSMRVDDQRVRGLSQHLDRLVRDCRTVFGTELDISRVRQYVRDAVGDEAGASVVRVTVFDPGLDLGHPVSADDPHVLVTHRSAAALPLPPLRVRTARYQRDIAQVKHTGLFGALHHRRAAQLAGFDDALFVDADGLISEGGTWNVGFISPQGVIWPKADVLPGITMALLQELSPHTTEPVPVDSLTGMRAAFAANTTIGVRAISTIDGLQLATEHPVLVQMRESFLALRGERL
ncbi:aminotransferase class IV family protein [Streptomyces sp. TRM 70351]|uniref:aminotransferase class IV family protein n=1 Tax=Streptomyces sp. TRM 70351 TaxID=3116552 RepID=UPI002E7C2EF7|nr:aminotransferase class IV family protein [Streptomyces sp. TRM 70351]MEE1931017.1 aminotransferase class IV family protein [Streptomyces sp. TRM 70351]